MKKNKKKNHRSKASRKRKAACKNESRVRGIKVASVDQIHQVEMINEIAHSFSAQDLGGKDRLGAMSLSLAVYFASIRNRLLEGEEVKENVFVQFAYSFLSMPEFRKSQELHANGGFNFSSMALAMAGPEGLSKLILQIEEATRDTVAVISEKSPMAIQTVHLTVDETDEEQDPRSAFGFPYEERDLETIHEQEVSVRV